MKVRLPVLVFFAALINATTGLAQTVVWSGTTSSLLNTTSNWSGAPAGADLSFGSSSRSSVFVTSSIDVNSITFTTPFPFYSLSGQNSPVLGIGAGGLTVGTQTGGGVQFNNSLFLALKANQTWTIGSPTTVSSGISSASAFTLTKTGAADLILNGGNTFSGGVTVQQGGLYLGGNTTVSGSVVLAGPAGTGTISLASGTTLGTAKTANASPSSSQDVANAVTLGSAVAGNNVTLSTQFSGSSSQSQSVTLSGALTAGSTATTIHLNASEPVRLTGSLNGPANTTLTFDSINSTFSGAILGTTFNANIASLIADNAGLFFLTTPPAAIQAVNRGYIGVATTSTLPVLSANVVLSRIAAGTRSSFAGTFGFDTDQQASRAISVNSENLDFSAFTHADFRIGSMTTAMLTGTITAPTSGGAAAYRFGGSSGLLIVKSNLADTAGAPTSLLVTSFAGRDLAYTVFQGNNTNTGSVTLDGVTAQLGVERSIAVLASANALPGGATGKFTMGAGASAYVGATESTGYSDFNTFAGHVASGGFNSQSILGLDSDSFYAAKIAGGRDSTNFAPRLVLGNVDLRLVGSVYFGTASALDVRGTIYAPSSGELSLTAVSRGMLAIASKFGSNVNSLVVGQTGATSKVFSGGVVTLAGSNTYSGGTTLNGGTLRIANTTKLNGSNAIVSGPIGTGALTIPTGSYSFLSASETLTNFANSIVLNGTLQIGFADSSSTPFKTTDFTTLNVTGPISGAGPLVISGWTQLMGANTHTGGTTVNTGAVIFNNAAAFGTGPITLSGFETSTFGTFPYLLATTSVNLSQSISMGGSVRLGATTGTLTLGGPITLSSFTNFTLTGPGSVAISGAISGNNSITSSGVGNLHLSGTNTYTGGTTVFSGGIIFDNAAAVPAVSLLRVTGTGYLGSGFTSNLQAGFLDRFDKQNTAGTVGFDSTTPITSTLDFTGFGSAMRIASSSTATLAGTITPASTTYNFGNGGGTLTVTSALTGTRPVNVTSNAETPLTLVLQGANTYNGGTTAQRSIVRFDGASAVPSSGLLNPFDYGYIGYTETTGLTTTSFLAQFTSSMGSNGIIGFDSASTSSPRTISSAISLSGFNATTYLGTSTAVVLDGVITPFGASNTVLNLTGVGGGSLVFNSAITSSSLVLGTAYQALSGNSSVTLNSANTFTGGTTLKYGRVILGSSAALGTGTVTVDSDGSGLSANTGGLTVANNFALGNTSVSRTASLTIDGPNNLTLSGALSGFGSLKKTGTGTLTLSGNNSALTGIFNLIQGSATFASDAAANPGGLSFASIAGATANYLGSAPQVKMLSSSNVADVLNLAANSTFTLAPMYDDDFRGVINGTAAKFVLDGGTNSASPIYYGVHNSNTYSGGTTIKTNAVLVAGNSGALGTTGPVELAGGTLATRSGVTLAFQSSTTSHPLVFNGGKLAGEGSFTFDSNLTLKSNSSGTTALSPGLKGTAGQLNLSFSAGSMLVMDSGGAYYWKLVDASNASGGWDTVNVAGAVNITATSSTPFYFKLGSFDPQGNNGFAVGIDLASTYSWTVLSATSITGFAANKFTLDASGFANYGTFTLSQNTGGTSLILNFTPSAVPEPSTWALMISGLAVIATLSIRRRRSA